MEPVKSSITVTEKLTVETPANISILGAPEVQRIPGINLDDRLRMVPGFSLFRRSSSLVANPTTQGISLRGIGSTGASRTLVLWDGIPVNDPFGGWITWTRISPDEIDRVEISRGASTSLFGDRAMGGAIALFSRPPSNRHWLASYEGGNLNTHNAGGGYSDLFGRLGVSVYTRGLTTDGYYIVADSIRGAADKPANVRSIAGNTRLDWLGARDRFFVKLDIVAEDRGNGSLLQRNSTSLGNIGGNYVRDIGEHSFSLLGFHTREEYHQSFSTIDAARRTERLTSTQRVPSEAYGGAGYWRWNSRRFHFVTGADTLRVEGYSLETLIPTGFRSGGGIQHQTGVFAQGDVRFDWLTLYSGVREHHAGAAGNFFTPSGGITAGRKRMRARASGYRSFRAPTLNELFREFRAGNAVTQANALLKPETLIGVEAGVDFVGENLKSGITFFHNSLEDLITNVTLSTTPALITRQRQNAGSATSRGVEFDFRQNWREFRFEGSYLFSESRFANRFRVPQIPKHQGSAQLTWQHKRTFITGGFRALNAQFEDEINRFLLPGFGIAQFTARQQIRGPLSAIAVVENLTNREYVVGFSPTPLIGAPRMWRLGLRWDSTR